MIAVGDGDLPVCRGPGQVIFVSRVEGQGGTGKERKKGLERFHDASSPSTLPETGEATPTPPYQGAGNRVRCTWQAVLLTLQSLGVDTGLPIPPGERRFLFS